MLGQSGWKGRKLRHQGLFIVGGEGESAEVGSHIGDGKPAATGAVGT
jgi:hypothetical protein